VCGWKEANKRTREQKNKEEGVSKAGSFERGEENRKEEVRGCCRKGKEKEEGPSELQNYGDPHVWIQKKLPQPSRDARARK